MDYEMESLIQALVIQINLIWNQFHGIIHELIRYAHALSLTGVPHQGKGLAKGQQASTLTYCAQFLLSASC